MLCRGAVLSFSDSSAGSANIRGLTRRPTQTQIPKAPTKASALRLPKSVRRESRHRNIAGISPEALAATITASILLLRTAGWSARVSVGCTERCRSRRYTSRSVNFAVTRAWFPALMKTALRGACTRCAPPLERRQGTCQRIRGFFSCVVPRAVARNVFDVISNGQRRADLCDIAVASG